MRRDKIDGRPTGVKGVITADEQLAALGVDKSAPKPAPLPPTPAEARRQMNDEYVGEDLAPPDWERSVVSDPATVAQALGARPEDFDSAPLGSQPEGQPIPQPGIRPKIEPRPERTVTTTRASAPSPVADAASKAKLAADFRSHAKKVAEIAESAKASGDADREARAAAEVAASRQVGEALKARGIL